MIDVELAYAAGLFDGEGSISLVRHRGNRWHSPQVAVASTDDEVVQWFQIRFGGSIVTKQPRLSTHSVSYDWRLTDRRALAFLTSIRPYLVIERKIRRIDLLLNDYLACTPRNGRYSEEMAERKRALIETFFSLPSTPYYGCNVGAFESMQGFSLSGSPLRVGIGVDR